MVRHLVKWRAIPFLATADDDCSQQEQFLFWITKGESFFSYSFSPSLTLTSGKHACLAAFLTAASLERFEQRDPCPCYV